MRPGAARDRDAGVEAAGGSPCLLPPSPVPSFWRKKDRDCCPPPSEGHREVEPAVTASLPPPAWRWVLSTQHRFCPGASLPAVGRARGDYPAATVQSAGLGQRLARGEFWFSAGSCENYPPTHTHTPFPSTHMMPWSGSDFPILALNTPGRGGGSGFASPWHGVWPGVHEAGADPHNLPDPTGVCGAR